VTKAQRERVRRAAAVIAIAQRPTVPEDADGERNLALRRWRGDGEALAEAPREPEGSPQFPCDE
jgi:hypothetical protein